MKALNHPAQFDAVFTRGRRHGGEFFVLHWLAAAPCVATPSATPQPPSAENTTGLRLGFILPKRLAKRAARRNQIKRQWRAQSRVAERAGLQGDVVVRLTRAFDAQHFRSPASPLLAAAVAREAQALLARCNQARAA